MAADQILIPEFPEGALALAGEKGEEEVYLRSDPLSDPGDAWRWWPLAGGDGDPVTWAAVCAVQHVGPDGTYWVPRPVERLYRQAEVDRMVLAAVESSAVETIGEHRVLPDGWCQTCDGRHSGPEIERARLRAAEGGDRG